MSKTAIGVSFDPKSGSEEALVRLFKAMFLTLELKEQGQDVAPIFQGAASRWPAEIAKPAQLAHALYHEGDKATGVALVREKEIANVGSILDLSRYLSLGRVLIHGGGPCKVGNTFSMSRASGARAWVSNPWRCQMPRTAPDDTWMPFGRSSCSTWGAVARVLQGMVGYCCYEIRRNLQTAARMA